jgi:hypothetical protein
VAPFVDIEMVIPVIYKYGLTRIPQVGEIRKGLLNSNWDEIISAQSRILGM